MIGTREGGRLFLSFLSKGERTRGIDLCGFAMMMMMMMMRKRRRRRRRRRGSRGRSRRSVLTGKEIRKRERLSGCLSSVSSIVFIHVETDEEGRGGNGPFDSICVEGRKQQRKHAKYAASGADRIWATERMRKGK